MKYEGSVHSGSSYYKFTIKPDTGVQWTSNRAPPTLKTVKLGAIYGETDNEFVPSDEPWMTGTIFTSDVDDEGEEVNHYAVRELAYIGIGAALFLLVIGLSCCILEICRQQRKGSPSDLAPYEQFL